MEDAQSVFGERAEQVSKTCCAEVLPGSNLADLQSRLHFSSFGLVPHSAELPGESEDLKRNNFPDLTQSLTALKKVSVFS